MLILFLLVANQHNVFRLEHSYDLETATLALPTRPDSGSTPGRHATHGALPGGCGQND
ncbi:hypothetical protein [Xanthomonas arboricola]|uniref:hypothetical protein n=1 Tax=Xanthomonas arboricola TaxID=56448 RepID=UPI0015E2AFA6|nr:hypothetical protein [Xanthomonas arboricola]